MIRMEGLENRIKKYQVTDWIPVLGTIRLMKDNERWQTLIDGDKNRRYSDFLYALSNVCYSSAVGGLGIIYGIAYASYLMEKLS